MKAAHAYAIMKRLCDAFNVQPSLHLEEFIREEMNALAAAQPEPRPLELEDLIPHEWRLVHLEQEQPSLWVCRIGLRLQLGVRWDTIISIQRTGQNMREAVIHAVEDIPKPTVTPK